MKYKKINITNEFLSELFVNGRSISINCPKDLKVIKCFNIYPNTTTFIIESNEFEDIKEGFEFPDFEILK